MTNFGLVAIAASSLLLSGCAAFSSTPPDDEVLRVAAAFYPLEYVAERVAGPDAVVVNLTTPGTEPHDLELTVRETAEVARADLVVHERGFQPSVDDAIDQNATGAVVDAAAVLELVEGDPHFWLDPLLMADLGDWVAEHLIWGDPSNAAEYQARAVEVRAELEALAAAYTAGLADCEISTVVVSHDAFGYLSRYGLEFEPIAGLSPGAEPTPADLGRLQQLVRDEGITTVFTERLVGEELAEALADDLGLHTEVLDPIEGLTDETADENYLSLMEQNLDALREANRCQ